jgi:nucleotide-binding universal stress UspA family protein
MTILVAIDDSSSADSALGVARRVATLFGTSVEGVHVQEAGSGRQAGVIADAANVPLHVRHGDVVSALRSEAKERDATALVIGIGDPPDEALPAGHVTFDLALSFDRPMVVVPPHAADRPLLRVLVAVEGDGQSHELTALYERLGNRPIPEVIVLHVVEPSELPPFSDSPVLEAEAFEREFMIRASRNVSADLSLIRFEIRVGDAPSLVCEAARELDADLVVMAWHRNLSAGHGLLVRAMLSGSSVPIALLPIDADEGANE